MNADHYLLIVQQSLPPPEWEQSPITPKILPCFADH